jgi:hypothetical protein
MKAKGCISAVLEWPTAREFFYWRIRRRQAEDPLKDRLVAASNGALTLDTAAERVSTLTNYILFTSNASNTLPVCFFVPSILHAIIIIFYLHSMLALILPIDN